MIKLIRQSKRKRERANQFDHSCRLFELVKAINYWESHKGMVIRLLFKAGLKIETQLNVGMSKLTNNHSLHSCLWSKQLTWTKRLHCIANPTQKPG